MPDMPSASAPDRDAEAYEAGTRFRPEHLVGAVLHEAMLHIRMQGFRLHTSHQQYGAGQPPRTCRRRWWHRQPPFTPPQAHLAPVWMVADLLHNSLGYLTDETHWQYAVEPGIEGLIMMVERIPQAPRDLDDLHLLAFLDKALRGTGWTTQEMRDYAVARAREVAFPSHIARIATESNPQG